MDSSPERDHDPFWIRSGLLSSEPTLEHLILLAPGRSASFVGSLVEYRCLEQDYLSWGLLGCAQSDLSLVLLKSLRLLRIQSEGGRSAMEHSQLAKCVVGGGGCAWNYSQLVESVTVCKSTQTQDLSDLVLIVGEHWNCFGKTPLCHVLPLLQRSCIETGIVLTII